MIVSNYKLVYRELFVTFCHIFLGISQLTLTTTVTVRERSLQKRYGITLSFVDHEDTFIDLNIKDFVNDY